MRPRLHLLTLAAATLALLACASHPRGDTSLASLTAPEALAILRMRAETIEATASTGTMTLTNPAGEQVTVDFAARTDAGRFRLRAWRFGEPVLDVTVNPDGAWVYAPQPPHDQANQDQRSPDNADTPALDLPAPEDLARCWRLISGEPLRHATVATQTPEFLTLATTLDNRHITTLIDRTHLRPTEYRFPDDPHRAIQLDPTNWIAAGGKAPADATRWPRYVSLTSDRGVIDITFDRAEVNPAHPAGVFEPPARAAPYEPRGEAD